MGVDSFLHGLYHRLRTYIDNELVLGVLIGLSKLNLQ